MKLEQYLEQHYKTKGLHNIIKRYTNYQNNTSETAGLTEILAYINHLRKQGLHPKTLRNHLFAIKIYYNYLESIGKRSDHPCRKLTLKDQVDRSIATEKLYSKDELDALLVNYQSKDKRLLHRNKVLISLMIHQALQVQEISQLQLTDIDLENAQIFVSKTTKNNARTLPLKANQILLFQRYLEERTQFNPTTTHFIISKYGTDLKPHGICRLINEGKAKEDRIHPLKIRQSVIALLLKSGNNLRLVQTFCGHKSSSSTEAYKQTDLEKLQLAVNNFHPIQ